MDDIWTRTQQALAAPIAALRQIASRLRGATPGADAPPREASGTRGATAGIRRSLANHVLAIVLIAGFLVGTIGVLGAMTDLAGAVIAAGSLVVESNVKKVQHPTGGVVGELRIQDGVRVLAGDLLIRLDPTEAQSNLTAVSKALWELTARRARLEAEREAAETVTFPPDLLAEEKDPEIARIITGERRLFELRRDAQRGQKAQLRERISQLNEEAGGLTEQAAAKKKEIDLVGKELGGVRELFDKNLIPISRLTALERDAARLEGERGLLTAQGAQTKGKISEIELQIIQLDQNLRSDVAKELGDIRAKMSELTEKKITAAETLKRIDIRAPQDGVVQQLAVHAKGSVIAPAEQIMLIVPQADALVVEVKVAPQDIDKIALDQATVLRFTSFNQRTTPELNGRVIRIGADTIKDDKTGTSYYLVRMTLDAGEIERLGEHRLVPGMPVEAFIKTRDRTMLSYFLKPLTDQARRAFREN